MTQEQAKDINRHVSMFGYDPLVKCYAGKFFVEFGALSIPTAFETRDDAIARARLCMQSIRKQAVQ